MVNIDEIMEMLDWAQPEKVQKKGRELARNVKSINVFILPLHKSCSKNVWDNCALILSEKSDEELKPYISHILEWLMDLTVPGALIILKRLQEIKLRNFDIYIKNSIKVAKALDEEMWVVNLKSLYKQRLNREN